MLQYTGKIAVCEFHVKLTSREIHMRRFCLFLPLKKFLRSIHMMVYGLDNVETV